MPTSRLFAQHTDSKEVCEVQYGVNKDPTSSSKSTLSQAQTPSIVSKPGLSIPR